jgi:hypothetical protein
MAKTGKRYICATPAAGRIEMMLDPGKSQPGMEVMRCSVAPSRPSGPMPRA